MAPTIVGMGNPLLDISCNVDDAFIKKYAVPLGAACLAEEKHMPMYKELTEMKNVEYIAGGATLNSIRVAKWALGNNGECGYFGAIGKDNYGELMQKQCQKDGIKTSFMINEAVPTGTCACGILDKERGLVANLSAANTFKKEHLDKNNAMLMKADIFYSAGFFVTVSPEAMVQSAETAHATGGVYCLNLAAPFIVSVPVFLGHMKNLIGFADYVFGNETEAATLAEQVKCATDATSVARYLASLPCKEGRVRTAVITQGKEKTVVARSDGFYMEVPVKPVDSDKIIDTNAAGDAFVGGFLAALAMGKSCEDCVLTGHATAGYIIQRSGCTYEGAAATRYEC